MAGEAREGREGRTVRRRRKKNPAGVIYCTFWDFGGLGQYYGIRGIIRVGYIGVTPFAIVNTGMTLKLLPPSKRYPRIPSTPCSAGRRDTPKSCNLTLRVESSQKLRRRGIDDHKWFFTSQGPTTIQRLPTPFRNILFLPNSPPTLPPASKVAQCSLTTLPSLSRTGFCFSPGLVPKRAMKNPPSLIHVP